MAWRLGNTDKGSGKVDYQVECAIPLAAIGLALVDLYTGNARKVPALLIR